MPKIEKFGQYITLDIVDVNGVTVLSTDSLRIDFDVRDMYSFSRFKLTIYNLDQETSLAMATGENYVTLKTSLHGGELYTMLDRMYVSNSVTTRKVPNTMTHLYGFSNLRKTVLEKQVKIDVKAPKLEKVVRELLVASGFEGDIDFKFFPPEILNYLPNKPSAKLEGSVVDKLNVLSKEFKFKYYTVGSDIRIGYIVDDANYDASELSSELGSITLNSNNMRANPKLGPSTLEIHSNLDPRIKPLEKLNVAKLLTAELTGLTDTQLSVSEKIVLQTVSNRPIYQVIFVQNKGSNWTGEWSTIAQAVAPTAGMNMPTTNWFR